MSYLGESNDKQYQTITNKNNKQTATAVTATLKEAATKAILY